MKVEVKNFKEDYWEELRNLIDNEWKKNHPITDPKLFFWQHKGFGEFSDYSAYKLLFIDGKLEGFRGVIPGIYQINTSNGERKTQTGASFAMWLVTEKYRGMGLGYKLLCEVEECCSVTVALGSNLNTSVPIYTKNDYTSLKALNRYVIPLEECGYRKLLSKDIDKLTINNWINEIPLDEKTEPIVPNLIELRQLWDKSNENTNLFSLYRNGEFWRWRYMNSPGYKYIFFGEPKGKGIVVARVESVCDEDRRNFNELIVFRIIEIVPYDFNVWNGENLNDMYEVICCALKWAKDNGCCAADFQCSTNRLEKLLYKVGFKYQDENYQPDICSLAGMFQPLKYKPTVINCYWKVRDIEGHIISIPAVDTYFVKSDNDQDRPVLWPVVDDNIKQN